MISHRLVTVWTVTYRILTLDHFTLAIDVGVLPLNKFTVLWNDCCKPPAPVDRKTELLHHAFVLIREVVHDHNWIGKGIQRLLRYTVKTAVEFQRFLILLCNPLCNTKHRCTGNMECHREQNLFPLHSPEPCNHIRYNIGSAVTYMHCTAWIGECNVDVELLFILCRIRLKGRDPGVTDLLLNFTHYKLFCQIDHLMHIVLLVHRTNLQLFTRTIAADHLHCNTAVSGKVNLAAYINCCSEEILLSREEINNLVAVLWAD